MTGACIAYTFVTCTWSRPIYERAMNDDKCISFVTSTTNSRTLSSVQYVLAVSSAMLSSKSHVVMSALSCAACKLSAFWVAARRQVLTTVLCCWSRRSSVTDSDRRLAFTVRRAAGRVHVCVADVECGWVVGLGDGVSLSRWHSRHYVCR